MRRGTTPTHIFHTGVDLREADVLYVTYTQNRKVCVEKDISDCTITADSVEVQLSQAETLSFGAYGEVYIQIRAGFPDGSRIASNIIKTTVETILKDGEI